MAPKGSAGHPRLFCAPKTLAPSCQKKAAAPFYQKKLSAATQKGGLASHCAIAIFLVYLRFSMAAGADGAKSFCCMRAARRYRKLARDA